MSLKNRLIAVMVMISLVILAVVMSQIELPRREQAKEQKEQDAQKGKEKDTLLIWYTDESLSDFINSAAVSFQEDSANAGVRVIPVLVSGLEYLENINRASVTGECPDLYVIGHDSLEKAWLAGLAAEITAPDGAGLKEVYPEVGLNAATYHHKLLGYPFYFETSALLYNRTYLEDMARRLIQAEADEAAAQEAQRDLEENGPEEKGEEAAEASEPKEISRMQVENRVSELLPETLAQMKEFADTYDAPEQVEAVFKWDVNDIFYNYFFVGHSMVIGGETGDDKENIDIYNPDAISSMNMYQNLSQFFAIDTNEVKYQTILEDFISGKLVFTVATTDAVARLEQAAEEGTFTYDYEILRTPDIDENTPTRSLSMTNCVVINGYSEYREAANRFAYYLTNGCAGNLYERAGKVPAVLGVDHKQEGLDRFAEEYARSIPLPKMMETSNFWVQLEIAFERIWNGANANQELKQLSEQIMAQVTGETYLEEEIIETKEDTQIEYLDEEKLRQEALSEE